MFNRIALLIIAGALTACSAGETLTRGYVASEETVAGIRPGMTQDTVLSTLGTPSTIATVNGDVFYYISQKYDRKLMFMKPKLVEQKVLAVYFDKSKKTERVANYGLQDGVVFDFISRTTPTGGAETSLLKQVLDGPRN